MQQKEQLNLDGFRLNVIYIGGTVEVCEPFLESLIDNTTIPLRFVANGCNKLEESFLLDKCSKLSNVEFFSLGESSFIEHGLVLDRLLAIEESDLFAFIDSDILATSTITIDALLPGPGKVGIFSCLPIWHTESDIEMPAHFKLMGGRFIHHSCGLKLGCTYLASYHTNVLRGLREETGISFRSYKLPNLHPNIKIELVNAGFSANFYDTAKIVNILLQFRCHEINYRPIPQLIHIGGLSGNRGKKANSPITWKKIAKSILPKFIMKKIQKFRFGITTNELNDLLETKSRREEISLIVSQLQSGKQDIKLLGASPINPTELLKMIYFYKHYATNKTLSNTP